MNERKKTRRMKSQHWNAKQKQKSFQCLYSEITRIFLIYYKIWEREREREEVRESISIFVNDQKRISIKQCKIYLKKSVLKKGICQNTSAINRRNEIRKIERIIERLWMNVIKIEFHSEQILFITEMLLTENEGKYCGGNRKRIVHMCEYILVVLIYYH